MSSYLTLKLIRIRKKKLRKTITRMILVSLHPHILSTSETRKNIRVGILDK